MQCSSGSENKNSKLSTDVLLSELFNDKGLSMLPNNSSPYHPPEESEEQTKTAPKIRHL